MLAEFAIALAAGTAAASLIVLYRDLKALVPFLVQVWMYSTPVFYPLEIIPSQWRWIAWLNPMTGIVETFRFALFGSPADWTGVGISALTFCVGGIGAALVYRKVETDLAERV